MPRPQQMTVPQTQLILHLSLEVEEGRNDAASYMPRGPDGAVAADYGVFTPRQDRPDPCEKMRQAKP